MIPIGSTYIKKQASFVTGLLILFGILFPIFSNEDQSFVSFQHMSAKKQLSTAIDNYEQQRYAEALVQFKFIQDTYPDAEHDWRFLYNLANTYYKENNLGLAIYYYRKAQKINPRHDDIQANLALAKSKIIDKETAQASPVELTLQSVSVNESWTILIVLLTIMNACFILMRKMDKKDIYKQVFGVSVGIFVLMVGLFLLKLDYDQTNRAVIVEKKVAAKSGPNDTLSTLFVIHEGTECVIRNFTQEWAQIELSNGFSGWIPRASFLDY